MKIRNKITGMGVLAIAGLAGIATSMTGLACNAITSGRFYTEAREICCNQFLEPEKRNSEYSRLMKEERKYGLRTLYYGLTEIALVVPTAAGLACWKRNSLLRRR